jgi:hypothetical protein
MIVPNIWKIKHVPNHQPGTIMGIWQKKTFWTLHLESERAAKQDLFSIDYPNDLGKLKYSTNLNSSATHLPFPGPCPAE